MPVTQLQVTPILATRGSVTPLRVTPFRATRGWVTRFPATPRQGDTEQGDANIGDSAPGDSSTGDSAPGDSNSGDSNSGDSNFGDSNSGDSNSGDSNSGDSNSGDSNSGDSEISAPTCTSCHGSGSDPAPPMDTLNNSDTSSRGVGAHQSHLATGSSWRADLACIDCHTRPAAISDVGHNDTPLPAELIWSDLATDSGALSPTFDGTQCSNVYCHGGNISGGSNITPTWTTVDGSQDACGTCHGLPPDPPHSASTTCETCHGDVMGVGTVIIEPTLHIDGIVQASGTHPAGWADPTGHGAAANTNGLGSCQVCHGANLLGGTSGISCQTCHAGWETDCTFCHGGTSNMTGAPPDGVNGETIPTDLAVGAHTEHVEATTMHAAWNCDRCHITPSSATTAGHIDGDGQAELTFDGLNPVAAYDSGTGVCSNLYCHGSGQTDTGTEDWDTDPPTLSCNSCHYDWTSSTAELDTMSGAHRFHLQSGHACSFCHQTTVDVSNTIIDGISHVDGSPDVTQDFGMTWEPIGRVCSGACHLAGSSPWP